MINSLVTNQIRENAKITEEQDAFGYHNLAIHLFSYIQEKNKECPTSIGIYGKWGSGKTVLASFLKDNAKNNDVEVVEIDAMEFKGEEKNIFEYFLYKIADKILEDKECKGFKFLKKNKKSNWIKRLSKNIANSNFQISGVTTPSLNSIFKGVFNREKELFELILKIKEKKVKGMVFIDNLDRLQPKETIIFLEKLKSFFLSNGKNMIDNFAYVLLCDFDILEREVQNIYGEAINVRDYLNKLIELPFYLPSIKTDNIKKFIKSLLKNDVSDDIKEKVCAIFEMAKIETPRDIKIFLMELDMTFVIAKARGKDEQFLIKNLNKILSLILLKSKDSRILNFLKERADIIISQTDRSNFIVNFHNYIFPSSQLMRTQIETKGDYATQNLIKLCDFIIKCFPKIEFSNPSNSHRLNSEVFLDILEIVDSADQKHTTNKDISEGLGISPLGMSPFGM